MPPLEQRRPMPSDLHLPLTMLIRYLFFLDRRPVSSSNSHYLTKRLAGLKSLTRFFAERGLDIPATVVQRVNGLNAANLGRHVKPLLADLHALAPRAFPADVVVSRQPPPPDLFAQGKRVLLLFGPAIGIGDEIISFSLPSWIKRAIPEAHVTVMSAYDSIWERVHAVDARRSYRDYADVVTMLRGDVADDTFDLVVLVDFELPGLLPALCAEPGLTSYLEIGMGARRISAWDGRRRRMYEYDQYSPYFRNFYHSLRDLCRWLGWPADLAQREQVLLRSEQRPDPATLSIFVCPFTSKYEPSEEYWCRLLAAVTSRLGRRPIRLIMEPGANGKTERFAVNVSRATQALVQSDVQCGLSMLEGGRTLSLAGVFQQMEQCQAVICTDSFAAHAAPLFDCTTLVLARANLQDWRVPSPRSLYFREEDPLPSLALGMRSVLASLDPEAHANDEHRQWASHLGRDLLTQGRALDDALTHADVEPLLDIYGRFQRSWQHLAASLDRWPRNLDALLGDIAYPEIVPPGPERLHARELAEFVVHARDKHDQASNSNLWKYLGLARGSAADHDDVRHTQGSR